MQTRKSINVVFLLVSFVMCLVMSRVFFGLMFNYYKEGSSKAVYKLMRDAGKVDSGASGYVGGMFISSDWNAFPEDFKKLVPIPPSRLDYLVKEKEKRSENSTEERLIAVLCTTNSNGKAVYVGKEFKWKSTVIRMGGTVINPKARAMILSLIFSAVVTVLLLFILKFFVAPLEALKSWAQQFSSNMNADVATIKGKFRFKEFAEIAEVIEKNIEQQKENIRSKQEFLNFSSHELRSPLAGIQSNIELLKRISINYSEKEKRVITRIDDATKTMTGLIETFLWVSRGEGQDVNVEEFDLSSQVRTAVKELEYLIANKKCHLVQDTHPFSAQLPLIPCQIMLRNMISNAFKHSSVGDIIIEQKGATVTVVNVLPEAHEKDPVATGFGLGLQLMEKIAVQYGWIVTSSHIGGEYAVTVEFSS